MPSRAYLQPGLRLSRAAPGTPEQVRDLQRDLRALGYLRRGIDGRFGPATELAVRGLQHDLLHNAGTGRDGRAPVRMTAYAKGRVTAVTGVLDQGLAACLAELMKDPRVPKLPRADDPAAENATVAATVRALPSGVVPTPYLVAILRQESGLMHFAVPRTPGDEDTYIIVGTDRSAPDSPVITSRGYGAGQYTLFHHPPRKAEVRGVMLNPKKNVERAAQELRGKLEQFVVGPADVSVDRAAEIGRPPAAPLRLCKYARGDPRYLTDCRACAAAAGTRDIAPGLPLYPGSPKTWAPIGQYATATYRGVPRRERIGCDWPYAVRRYNGGGLMSFHYQARVLTFLLQGPG